jgi:hypothetical protein
MIHRAFFRIGALGEIASVIRMIGTGFTQIGALLRPIKRNARMTIGFKCGAAIGAGDCLRINCLTAAGASGHGISALHQHFKGKGAGYSEGNTVVDHGIDAGIAQGG